MATVNEMLIEKARQRLIRYNPSPTPEEIQEYITNVFLSGVTVKTAMRFTMDYPSEWLYFQEYARRFDDNEPNKRYGILVMNTDPCEDNMIYADSPDKLRRVHIFILITLYDKLLTNTPDDVSIFLRWLEGVEGKKPRIPRHITE